MNPNLHELAALLLALGRAGIELAPHPTDAGRLRHRPAELPPDLLEALRVHRGAILGLLAGGFTPDPGAGGGDSVYVYGERLGVADGLGLATHPGSAAWLVAVGESMGCSCHAATYGVHSGHGTTDEGHSGGGEVERSNALCDRQGRGRGP